MICFLLFIFYLLLHQLSRRVSHYADDCRLDSFIFKHGCSLCSEFEPFVVVVVVVLHGIYVLIILRGLYCFLSLGRLGEVKADVVPPPEQQVAEAGLRSLSHDQEMVLLCVGLYEFIFL